MDNQNINNIPNANVEQNAVAAQPQTVQSNVTTNMQAQQVQVPVNNTAQVQQTVQPKKKSHLGLILTIFIILGLCGACFMLYQKSVDTESFYKHKYSPINRGEEVKLDINSTLVQDLYHRFKTTEREDYYGRDLNLPKFKLYIALRNVSYNDYISSNCNLFDNSAMPFTTCPDGFTPNAVDQDVLFNKLKVLYGENHNVPISNIQLGNSCLGSFQYIKGRKQFVEGKCHSEAKSMINVEKKLLSAVSNGPNIILREKVRYYTTTIAVPDYLKNGIYKYTFRLDENFNYVFESKEHTEEID